MEPFGDSEVGIGPETASEVVDDLLGLPIRAQLGVLRSVVPRVLSGLSPEEREGFWRVLRDEVDLAALGEEPYDLRVQGAAGPVHEGRRESALGVFLAAVADKLPDRPKASTLFDSVVSVVRVLGMRVGEAELENVLAQLPIRLREAIDEAPFEEIDRPRRIDKEAFLGRVADDCCGGDLERARQISHAVLATLTERLGNVAARARRQLPLEFRELF